MYNLDWNGCVIFDEIFLSTSTVNSLKKRICMVIFIYQNQFCISYSCSVFCFLFLSAFCRSCPSPWTWTRTRAIRQHHIQEPATSQLQRLHVHGYGCGDGQAPSAPTLYRKILTQALISPSGGPVISFLFSTVINVLQLLLCAGLSFRWLTTLQLSGEMLVIPLKYKY